MKKNKSNNFSKDKDLYKKLCENDDKINTLEDLNESQDKYFNLVFGTHTT